MKATGHLLAGDPDPESPGASESKRNWSRDIAMCRMCVCLSGVLISAIGCQQEGPVQQVPEVVVRESETAAPDEIVVEKHAPETKPPAGQARSIIAVPRPNSLQFPTEQATKLLPEFLGRSVPVLATDDLVTEWKSPTQGIRVHITADDSVAIVNFFGEQSVGLGSIDAALNSTMTFGNARSVLLTSEIAGWGTPVKRKVVEILFQPMVQIYIVVNDT